MSVMSMHSIGWQTTVLLTRLTKTGTRDKVKTNIEIVQARPVNANVLKPENAARCIRLPGDSHIEDVRTRPNNVWNEWIDEVETCQLNAAI